MNNQRGKRGGRKKSRRGRIQTENYKPQPVPYCGTVACVATRWAHDFRQFLMDKVTPMGIGLDAEFAIKDLKRIFPSGEIDVDFEDGTLIVKLHDREVTTVIEIHLSDNDPLMVKRLNALENSN